MKIITTSAIILGLMIAIGFHINAKNHQDNHVAENPGVAEVPTEAEINKYLDAILLASNSNNIKDNRAFHELVDSINIKLINSQSRELNLTKDAEAKIIEDYYKSRSAIIDEIHSAMLSKQNLQQKTEISYEHMNSLNGFSESVSASFCNFLPSVIPGVNKFISFTTGKLIIKPGCANILPEFTASISNLLMEKAIIKDTNIIVSTLEENIRSSLLKLATAQDTLHFNIRNIEKRDFDPFGDIILIGDLEFSKVSELEAHVKAEIIAGFDLSSYSMNIEHDKRILSINLPEPSIISNSINVNYKEPNTEAGSPTINSQTYNKIVVKAKAMALKSATKNKLLDEARKNAYSSIMNMFQPLMSLPQFNYKVEIYFNQNIYLDGDTKIDQVKT